MIENKDIVVIGSIDWKTNWQTQHRLITALHKQNNRVLYIENTGIRSAKISDIPRIKDRLNNWLKSTKGFSEKEKNLFTFSPILLPFPFNKICQFINSIVIKFLLVNWFKSINFRPVILISFLPSPLSYEIKKLVNADINIYYCANEMKGIKNNNKKIDYYESLFFKESDKTIVISDNLKKKAKKFTKEILFLPAGVELEKFNYSKTKKTIPIKGKPVIGYIGAVTEVFDQDLLTFIANKNPDLNFVIVGRKYVNLDNIKNIKNIFFINEIPHKKVSSYLKGFDVGIIPYKVNKFTHSVYSSKLNEYLAMGLPTVSTNIKECFMYNKLHGDIIDIAKNFEQFSSLLNVNHKKNNQSKKNKRISIAKKNSWDLRLKIFNKAINEKYLIKKKNINIWKKRFINYYKHFFYRSIKSISVILLFLFIMFVSPFPSYMGSYLVLEDKLEKSDLMVVVSGDGENNYHNLSFQKRILDIKEIKNKYPDIKIVLTGRRAIYRESEIIKSLLINEGMDRKDLIIIRDDPYNTFKNIVSINNYLIKEKISKIIFLTSPYHTLRSKLIWKKNYPEIKVIVPKMVDTPTTKFIWRLSYEKIRIIFYEYLAIIYNKTKGWI